MTYAEPLQSSSESPIPAGSDSRDEPVLVRSCRGVSRSPEASNTFQPAGASVQKLPLPNVTQSEHIEASLTI